MSDVGFRICGCRISDLKAWRMPSEHRRSCYELRFTSYALRLPNPKSAFRKSEIESTDECSINHVLTKPASFYLLAHLIDPDWAPGPVQMCRDRRDVAGRVLKVRFGCVFVGKVSFLVKFGSPSATYPFLGPLILEDCFRNASTRFGACFSFRTRSSNLISVSKSLPNHQFFKNDYNQNIWVSQTFWSHRIKNNSSLFIKGSLLIWVSREPIIINQFTCKPVEDSISGLILSFEEMSFKVEWLSPMY